MPAPAAASEICSLPPLPLQYGAPPGALTLAYGGSYAGSLAVYARQLHPHVFGAAYASSAVVKMVLPTPSYQAVRPDSWAAMSAALREAGGARCAAFAGAAFDGLQFLEGSAAGRQQLAVAVRWAMGVCAGRLAGIGGRQCCMQRAQPHVMALHRSPPASSYLQHV